MTLICFTFDALGEGTETQGHATGQLNRASQPSWEDTGGEPTYKQAAFWGKE